MPNWTAQFRSKSTVQRLTLVVVVMFVGAMYALTMPRSITLEDAGLFQMVCHLGGISHPPGYPLFTLLCQQMVWGDTVIPGNAVSTIFALGAVIMLFHVVCALGVDKWTALIAATAYGISATFWSQAIIIEVYSLAAFLFIAAWWLLLRFLATNAHGYAWGVAAVAGLSLANHWPIFVLSCLEMMRGGEIFVPKITSMRVTDMARCMAPDLPHRNVGIRAGEKLHEVMISEDDARVTVELDDRYAILAPFLEARNKAYDALGARPVAPDFRYASDTNTQWMATDELERWISANRGKIGTF